MKRPVLSLLLALALLALTGSAAQATLTAQLDREQIAPDETLTLTLSRDDGSPFSSVDLHPLEKDFSIVGRSQSSSTQFINGSVTSSLSLILSLAPKRTGVLTIPPLTVGGESSQPLTVKVLSQPQPKTRADNGAIFLEAEVDSQTVTVQEQLLLTLRIFVAVQAQIGEPELPPLADALVEKLADARYSKAVNGRNYQVFERRYAIFPQQSGVLTIPPLRVRATVVAQAPRANDMFGGFLGARQQEVNLASEPERITVREKAPSYPAGAAWLPAGQLTAAVDWSRPAQDLRVGDSATVTITLTADGLLAAQLPPVHYPDLEGVKIYQGQGELQNLAKGDGVTGIRKESIAIIPTRPGTVRLPEIRIPWWNKNSRRVEYAVIPAQDLRAKGGTGLGPAGGVAPAPGGGPALPAPATSSAPGPEGAVVGSAQPAAGLHVVLAVFGGVLLLGWLATLYLLLKTRRQLAALAAGPGRQPEAGLAKEPEAYRALAEACRGNDPGRARKAFWAWARLMAAGETVRSGSDLERVFPGAGLVAHLEEIDRALYGGAPTGWQGRDLLLAVDGLRKGGAATGNFKSPLPPLYR